MEVRKLAENIADEADHFSVKRHLLDNTSGFLNTTPPAVLINEDESVQFVFHNRDEGIENKREGVKKYEPSNSCGTLLIITNQRALMLLGKDEQDIAISVPYGAIEKASFDTSIFNSIWQGIAGLNKIHIKTSTRWYTIPVEASKKDLQQTTQYIVSCQESTDNSEIDVFKPDFNYNPREHSPTPRKSIGDEVWKQVEDRKAEGWEVEEIDHENKRVIMKTGKGGTIGGHAVTGLTTGLWTFGLGNVAYEKLSKKRKTERIVLRSEDNLPTSTEKPKQLDDVSDRLHELKELYDEEVLTDDEFKSKKEELMEDF